MDTRPLGEISNFVMEGLPGMLAHVPHEIPRCVEGLLTRNPRVPDFEDEAELILACLDVKMLEAAIVHSGLHVPILLTAFVNEISGDELPMLNYGEIVLGNPKDDLRRFTYGELGETEAAFYRGHDRIEEQLAIAVRDVRRALTALASNDVEAAAAALSRTKHYLAEIPATMSTMRRMPKGQFDLFRRYLATHPVRKLKGPSGAFSAGVYTLEMLFRGDELPTEYVGFLDANEKYFPRSGRFELAQARSHAASGQTLRSLWRRHGESAELGNRLDELGGFFNGFRHAHKAAVAEQLPAALTNQVAGTGGELHPGDFLRQRIESTRYRRT